MFRVPGSVALISLDTASGDVQRLVDWVPHLDETDAAVLADPHRTESEWLSCGFLPASPIPRYHRPCLAPSLAVQA